MGTVNTEHEVAVFEEEDGFKFLLVWIDAEDINTFDGVYTEDEWQSSIEEHEFVKARNLPVVIAFEKADGTPRLYGPAQYVDAIAENFDWDNINWGHKLTLRWETED